jgi:CRISPR-associated endonuclease Csn1
LHEETNYGPTDRKDEKGQSIFVYRKSLEALTVPMVEKIVDPIVRQIVKNRLVEKGIDVNGDERKIPKEVWAEPLYMKNKKSDKKVLIKKVRVENIANNVIEIKDKFGKIYRAVEPGKNHHIEIFEYKDKNGETKRDSRVITMFDAVQRSRQGKPVVCKDYGDSRKFICSLVINDLVIMKDKTGKMDIYRVQKMDINSMVRFRHHTASKIDKKETYIDKTAHLFEGNKISIDLLGRIYLAND